LKITFWGTRGSIPTPSTASFLTQLYGGETTCVSIEFNEHLLIIDAGTGIRLLGLELLKNYKSPFQASIFFTHVHWDHIQGFPFFTPIFREGNKLDLYSPPLKSPDPQYSSILEMALRNQQLKTMFPVAFDELSSQTSFHTIKDTGVPIKIGHDDHYMMVSCEILNHPGGSCGYRFEEYEKGRPVRIFAFASDTEHGEDINPSIQKLAKDADVFVYDGQYTTEEYVLRKGWGHSTWDWGLREGSAAKVKHLLLTHHDPLHDDARLQEMENSAIEGGKLHHLPVQFAKQSQVIDL
jgi:phosphoribosyl 1,2-cyclic phosphodiesterase